MMRRISEAVISLVGLRMPWRHSEEIVVSFQNTYVVELTRQSGMQVLTGRFRSRRAETFERFHYTYDQDVFSFDAPRSSKGQSQLVEGERLAAFVNPLRPEDVWFRNQCQTGRLIQATTDPVGRWARRQAVRERS